MADSVDHVSSEELLVHAQWIRALARRLTNDAAEADDVVQETWLHALRRPPRYVGAVRPWLAKVVRNAARGTHRGEERRRYRETERHRTSPTEPLPSTDELVEGLEVQRVLAEELAALDEPYRTTLLLRYYRDFSAAEIARRQHVPAGTVRWRLKQGLDVLRGRLDGRFGGERSTWCSALAAWAGTKGGGAIAVSAMGVVVMSTVLKAGLAAAALAVVWLGLAAFEVLPPSLSPFAATAVAEEAALVLPPPDGERGLVAAVATPEAPEAETRTVVAVAEPEPAREDTTFRVRFVDPAGTPLAGVRVRPGMYASFAEVTSGNDGRAEVIVERDGPGLPQFIATCAGFGMHIFKAEPVPGGIADVGEITLHPGAMVGGRVVDAAGNPVEGVFVFLVPFSDLRGQTDEEQGQTGDFLGGVEDVAGTWPSTTSGADGSFRIDSVPEDRWSLWAGGGRWRYTFTAPMSPFAGDDRDDLVLVLGELRDEDVIAGIVLDPDGMPVPDVQVDGVFQSRRVSGGCYTVTDERGRFRLRLPFAVSYDLTAIHPEYTWFAVTEEDVEPGTHDVELRFRTAEAVTLRVRDPTGNPIEDYRVEVLETTPGKNMSHRPRAVDGPSRTSVGGGRLPDLHAPEGISEVRVPARPVDLDVSAPGYETLTVESVTAANVDAPIDCTLVLLPSIRGRVLADGQPVAGARVELMVIPVEGRFLVNGGMPSLVNSGPYGRETTDADGRFALSLRLDAERLAELYLQADFVRLRVRAEGWATLLSAPLPVPATEEVSLQLSPGGAIEGCVLDPGGSSVAGTLVAVTNGDGLPAHLQVQEDGRFRFEFLAPGDWFVRVVDLDRLSRGWGGRVDGAPEFPVSCRVREGETTVHDVDLAPFRQRLEGELTIPGTDASEWEAMLLPVDLLAHLNKPPTVNLDRQGRFVIDVGGEGTYLLLLKEATDDRGRRLRIMDTIELRGGRVDWHLELELATLGVTNASGTLYHVWRGEGDLVVYRELPHEDGTVPPTPVPAGRSWITREYPGRRGEVFDPARRLVLEELDLPPGTSHTVDLR